MALRYACCCFTNSVSYEIFEKLSVVTEVRVSVRIKIATKVHVVEWESIAVEECIAI